MYHTELDAAIFPLLPPPPTFSVRLLFLLCPGVLFLVAPRNCKSFSCGPTWVMLYLPFFVLCMFFRSFRASPFWALGVSVWCFCLCVFLGLLCLCCAPFCIWLFLSWFLAVVGSPPCQILLPLPPRLVPCGALAQF